MTIGVETKANLLMQRAQRFLDNPTNDYRDGQRLALDVLALAKEITDATAILNDAAIAETVKLSLDGTVYEVEYYGPDHPHLYLE